MAPNDHDQLRRLFDTVLDASKEDREAVLDRVCNTDADLRLRLCAMVKAAEGDGFLASPTADLSPSTEGTAALSDSGDVPREHPGERIGRYKLLQQIGEGGFGTVWMAEQKEPVKRRVALKIIKLGMDTKQVIARFEAERQALAMMDHPNIARVLDAGSTETGRPFFVMEYIRGVPMIEYCDTEKLDTKARLDLFTTVCHAIQHAHQKGIIHRDIKPSNVMVTMHDGVPVPKVIDFGIAKATSAELTTKTLFTEHRQMIGTPAYMSPEQAEMSGLDIDTRADIYSLGVLLYELLTGTTPFDTKSLMESGYAEMMRVIREDEPHKPSTRLSSLGDTGTRTALLRHTDVKKLGMVLRGDLDWIVMKCLEKDRTRRYETARGLAADIVRHLRDEPITAGRPSMPYRCRKFYRRNRVGVLTAGVVTAAMLAGLTIATVGFVQASRERDRLRASETRVRLLRQLFSGGQVSLAVLPLENRMSDVEHEYMAGALTTTLVNDLSRISALQVEADDSVRSALRGIDAGTSLSKIASELNVDGVVTGWIEPDGAGFRLTIQLMHALTSTELSEHVYEGQLGSIRSVEHAVSRDIVAALELDLTTNERARLSSARSVNPDAESAYLKSVYLMKRQSISLLERALEHLEDAIRLEPEYAEAYAARATVLTLMENRYAAPLDTMPAAREAARRAIELDDTLGAAYEALGIIQVQFDWDWDGAEESFVRAMELEPNRLIAGYAVLLTAIGESERAIDLIQRVMQKDPFYVIQNDYALFIPYMCSQFDLAIEYSDIALNLDPEYWQAYVWKGLALAEFGEFDQAIEYAAEARRVAEFAHQRDPENYPAHLIYAAQGGICARAADVEDDPVRAAELRAIAREALDRVDELRATQFICPYETATVHLALGEIDKAYAELYQAIDVRSACIPWLGVDPRYDGIRSDDRFTDLVRSNEQVLELFQRLGHLPSPAEGEH